MSKIHHFTDSDGKTPIDGSALGHQCDVGLAIDMSLGAAQAPLKQVEQCRLPSSVGSHEGGECAWLQFQIHTSNGLLTFVTEAEVVSFEAGARC